MIRLALALLLATAPALAQTAPPAPGTQGAVLAATTAADWRSIAPENLLVMSLTGRRRVLIELAPAFAPRHVANIAALARAGWYDGVSINRVQDNYVTQWGDASEAKPLPTGLAAGLAPEWQRPLDGLTFAPIPGPDGYAPAHGFVDSWPVATDARRGLAWLAHCYAMVGVGRGDTADSGNGAELYAVIGHAPRNLDRNVTLVGRVVEGIEHLASLPRGTEALGFYTTEGERVPILSVRLADSLPPGDRPRLEVLRSDTGAFRAWVTARAARADPWYVTKAGFVDLCNVRPPVRRMGG